MKYLIGVISMFVSRLYPPHTPLESEEGVYREKHENEK